MRKYALIAALSMVFSSVADTPYIIPEVKEYKKDVGSLYVPSEITVSGQNAIDAIKSLQIVGVNATESTDGILKVYMTSGSPESYTLEISSEGITLKAADEAGIYYGANTLSQILRQSSDGMIDACVINDSPRMGYRGLMLDLVRCYLPIDEVKKLVDVASQLKLNKVHLHLTDDNGWRMEINKYPRLTEVGAWRVDRDELFPARANPKEDELTTYGGYYTQDQLRDLVSYAAERQIEIIPEIEMPAHAVAAIASYPELACPVNDEFVGVLTGIGARNAWIIMCAGNDNTLQFVTDVLDEVMDVFPSEYIHLGGDEANKTHWEKCDLCKKRIADEGLADFEALQAWFMDSITSYVNNHGRTAIGWDEVTYGRPQKDMVIMGWQGDGSVAVNYARETGSKFIMTPAKSAYLIRYQGPQWFEPFTYFGNITLKDAYDFEPVKSDWTTEMREKMLGIQGSMWTEFCREPEDVQYQIFPRLVALADVAWREEGTKNWEYFIKALDNFTEILDEKDVAYAESMYNIQHTALPTGTGQVTVMAECIRPDAEIMFAKKSDFSNSEIYSEPLVLDKSEVLYFKASTPTGKSGKSLKLPVLFNKATGMSVTADDCDNQYHSRLTNGVRGSKRNSDFEWAGWYGKDARFEVKFNEPTSMTSITIGALNNANMLAGLPTNIKVWASEGDNAPTLIGEINIPEDKRFALEPMIENIKIDVKESNYDRLIVEAVNPGPVPDGMPREGTKSWIYFDEIIIE